MVNRNATFIFFCKDSLTSAIHKAVSNQPQFLTDILSKLRNSVKAFSNNVKSFKSAPYRAIYTTVTAIYLHTTQVSHIAL